jgi:hypothetical protein
MLVVGLGLQSISQASSTYMISIAIGFEGTSGRGIGGGGESIAPSGGGIANDPLLSKLARLVTIVAASTGDVGPGCANWTIEAGVGAPEEKYPEKPHIAGEGSTPALFGVEAGS